MFYEFFRNLAVSSSFTQADPKTFSVHKVILSWESGYLESYRKGFPCPPHISSFKFGPRKQFIANFPERYQRELSHMTRYIPKPSSWERLLRTSLATLRFYRDLHPPHHSVHPLRIFIGRFYTAQSI